VTPVVTDSAVRRSTWLFSTGVAIGIGLTLLAFAVLGR